MRRGLVYLALVTLLACSDALSPPAEVQGSWAADYSVPGASLVLDLVRTEDSIAGDGTYAIEAGRSGTVQVAGAYARPAVSLTITYDYGPVETFTGAVLDSRRMTGTMADSAGDGVTVSFTRR